MTEMMMMTMIIITMTKIKILIINARTECTVTSVPVVSAAVRNMSTATDGNYVTCNKTAYKESHFRLPTAGNITRHLILIFAESYRGNKLQHTDKTA